MTSDFDDESSTRATSDQTARQRAATAIAALEFIAKSLAEDPAAVSIEVNERQGKVVLSLSVGAQRHGTHHRASRTHRASHSRAGGRRGRA